MMTRFLGIATLLVFFAAAGLGLGEDPGRGIAPKCGSSTTRPAAAVAQPSMRLLKIVTCNIRDGRYGIDRIAAYLREQDADVVFLQEVLRRGDQGREGQAEQLARKLGGMHWVSGDTPGLAAGQYCDVAVLARWPLEDVAKHEVPAGGRVFAISAKIGALVRPLRVMSLHATSTANLDSAQIAKSAGRRFEEMAALLEYVRGHEGDIVVAGDFNASPWMPEYHSLTQTLTDLAPPTLRSKATFPSYRPSLRIDYVFGRGEISATSFAVGKARLSDHLPLTVEILLGAKAQGAATTQPTTQPSDSGEKEQGGAAANREYGTSHRPDRRCDG